jgi:pectate lyase
MKKLVFLLAAVALLSACHKDIKGKWEDNIHLAVNNAVFNPNGDSLIIATGGGWWWIDGVQFDDSAYCAQKYDNFNPEADTFTISEKHFTVQKRGRHMFFAKLDKNTSGKERILNISLEAGDYFDGVTIRQPAK